MARIAGQAAQADLLELMRGAQRRRSREGAVHGLGELQDPGIAPQILAAVRDRRIGRFTAGAVIAKLAVPAAGLVAWLQSADESAREVAIDAVFFLAARGALRDVSLALAARGMLAEGGVRIAPRTRRALENRIDTLLRRT
jgi:hypothetical protein